MPSPESKFLPLDTNTCLNFFNDILEEACKEGLLLDEHDDIFDAPNYLHAANKYSLHVELLEICVIEDTKYDELEDKTLRNY